MLSQDVLDEIFGALATSVGGSNGDYKEGSGNFTTSGGTVTLGTSSDKFDHGTADVDVEFIVDHFFYATTNYTTAQAQATLNFEVSADGTFTDLTSATKTHTLQFNEYDLSSYYGYTYLVYYLTGDVTKTFTSGSGNDIPDDTDLQFRVSVTGVGTAFTSQTVPFTLEANEGVTGVVSTGGNADTLDNLDSTAFLRSNTNDTFDGDLTITGQLILQGSIDQYNVTDLDVTDKTITVNSGNTQSLSDGAGLIVDRGTAADASITWDETNDEFDFSHSINVTGSATFSGDITSRAIVAQGNGTTSSTNALKVTKSGGESTFTVRDDGVVLVQSNYLYVNNSAGFYSTGSIRARGGITNDGGNALSISSGAAHIAFNSKNFASVGTISSGAITSSGNITASGGASVITAGTTTGYLYAKSLRLVNGEVADSDFQHAYQMIVDANDTLTIMSNKGDFTGGYPFGIYFLGDNGGTTKTLGSGLVGVWNTTNFKKVHVDHMVGLYDGTQDLTASNISVTGTLSFTANPAYIQNDQDNSGQIIISTKNSSGSAQQVRWDAANAGSGAWRPEVTNVSNLGLTNRIWNTLYVNNIRIGSGNDQFVDASRNITAGTISSGALTATSISATSLSLSGAFTPTSIAATSTVSGSQFRASYGSESAPAFTFKNDDDTGMYGSAARIHFAVSGDEKIQVQPSSIILYESTTIQNELKVGTIPQIVITSARALQNISTGAFSGKLTINNANYANHLELVRGSDTLYLTPSGGQLITNGGLSPDVTNQDDLGRSDKYWQDLWLGTSLKMGGTTVIDASRKLVNSTGATIAHSQHQGVKVTGTDSNANTSFTSMRIDHNASGSTALTADRSHIALAIDMDSSATGGDTSNEHRLYGIHNSVKATGDSDLVYGIFSNAEAEQTAGQVSTLIGVYGQATTDAVAGQVSNSYGVFGYNSLQSSSGTTINNAYAIYGKALVGAAQDSNIGSVTGLYAEVEIDGSGAGTTVTSVYGVRSEIDNDAGSADTTITNGYLFYGNYAGDLPTSRYGIYIVDNVRNYFGGNITTFDGSTTTAAYGFNGDVNTGMYSPANHQLGF